MATFIRLVDYDSSEEKEKEFFNSNNFYTVNNLNNLKKIPRSPIAYWASNKTIDIFDKHKNLEKIVDLRSGISTGDNDRFYRFWFEPKINDILFNGTEEITTIDNEIKQKEKWVIIITGGENRKWYGNQESVLNLQNNAYEIRNSDNNYRLRTTKYYFLKGITWSRISSDTIAFRLKTTNVTFGENSPSLFIKGKEEYYLSILNSKVTHHFLSYINPTLSFQVIDLARIPIIEDKITETSAISEKCIVISRDEWNSQEISWDFVKNDLISHKPEIKKLSHAYKNYCEYWKEKFFQLHKNEEELNKIFIEIYGLQDELTPDVPLEDITILNDETEIKNKELVFKKEIIIKQFISYSVGCMFGRYSLDKEGLILANQGETINEFHQKITNPRFTPDDDNIIPVLGDEYFKDDIIDRFKEFLRVTFDRETLAENLDFIADAFERNKNETSEQTLRRYFVNQFFYDHCKMYKNRPIYWLFTSGPEKAFNALIYMHRYNRELLAKMRMDYLHELQSKLEAKKETIVKGSSNGQETTRVQQQLTRLNKQLEELARYDEILKHIADQYIEIDLDDGVKANYKKFTGLVAEI
jgi:hypothetical protein